MTTSFLVVIVKVVTLFTLQELGKNSHHCTQLPKNLCAEKYLRNLASDKGYDQPRRGGYSVLCTLLREAGWFPSKDTGDSFRSSGSHPVSEAK